MGKQEIIERIPQHTAPAVVTPMDMLNNAVTSGADVAILEKLMGLQERWEANQARKSFNEAIAAAKGEIPPIIKNKSVDFSTGKGRTAYRYEDLAEVVQTVEPILHRHGLSFRYRTEQNGQRLRVICILSHRDGYSEETSLEASEDHSGNKNTIQAVGSAVTYLQRYTLKLALGLAATNDDDARAASVKTAPVAPPYAEDEEFLSPKQVEALRRALDVVGRDEARFCKYLGVARLEDIYADKFQACLDKIEGASR